MSDNIIEWGLIAKDEASAVMEKVAKAEEELMRASNATSKAVASSSGSWKEVATGVLTGQAAIQAVTKAYEFMKEAISGSIQEAVEFERNQRQLSAALASTGGAAGVTLKELNDMAGELSRLTAVDDDVINSMQAMQLTFTNITKDTFKATSQAALDMATAMNGGVLPSAEQLRGTMIQLGKALNNPKDGVTALTRVGVNLTEQQKKQIEVMLRHNDVIAAQKVVLAELAKEFGGSAEAAANSFQGRMAKLQNAIGDVQKVIGQVLLPTLSVFSDEMTDTAGNVQVSKNQLIEWQRSIYVTAQYVKTFALVIGGFVRTTYDLAKVVGAVDAAVFAAFYDMYQAVKNFGESARTVFSAIKKALTGDFEGAFAALKDGFRDTFATTKFAIEGVQDAFNEFTVHAGQNANEFSANWNEAQNHTKFDAVIKGMEEAEEKANKFGKKAAKPFADLAEEVQKSGSKTKEAMKEVGDSYEKSVNAASESLAKLDEAHAKTTADITDKISDLKKQLQDLQDTYQQTMGDLNKTEAEKVVDQEKKIADLKKQIAEEEAKQSKDQEKGTQNLIDLNEKLNILLLKQSEMKPSSGGSARESLKNQIADVQRQISEGQTGGGDSRLAELKAQFQKEQNAYDQYYAKGVTSLDSEITEARRRAGLTEFERFVEDNNKKRTETQKEYDQKTALLKQNLTDQETALGQERIIYESKKAMYLETQTKFQEFHDSYVTNLKSMGNHSEKVLTLMKQKLGDINATLDAIEKAKTKAGIASAAGFTPIDQTPSSSAASGGTQNQTVSINFGDVSINSQQQLNDLVNKITRQLQLVKVGSQ